MVGMPPYPVGAMGWSFKWSQGSPHHIALAFYKTASLMGRVSHVHLAFVHGICRGSYENIQGMWSMGPRTCGWGGVGPPAHNLEGSSGQHPQILGWVERSPWIAPECLSGGDNSPTTAADKRSFGATCLELCFDAEAPPMDCDPSEKECFYRKQHWLPQPSHPELATLTTQCLT